MHCIALNFSVFPGVGRGFVEEIMEAVDSVVRPVKEFAKDSIRLVKRCHKPDRRGICNNSTMPFVFDDVVNRMMALLACVDVQLRLQVVCEDFRVIVLNKNLKLNLARSGGELRIDVGCILLLFFYLLRLFVHNTVLHDVVTGWHW